MIRDIAKELNYLRYMEQYNLTSVYKSQVPKGWRPYRKTGRDAEPPKHTSSAEYNIFICSQCGTNLRIPAGKGRVQLTCPKCRNQFIVND